MTARLPLGALVLAAVALLPGCSQDSSGTAERKGLPTRTTDAPDEQDVARWRTPRAGVCRDLLSGLADSWAVSAEVIDPQPEEVEVTCMLLRDDPESASAAAVSVAVGESAETSYETWVEPYENGDGDLDEPTVGVVDGWEDGRRYVATGGSRGSAAEMVHSEGIAIRVTVTHGRVRGQTGAAYDEAIATLNEEASDVADAVVSAAATTLGR